jgi:hypothetical protein
MAEEEEEPKQLEEVSMQGEGEEKASSSSSTAAANVFLDAVKTAKIITEEKILKPTLEAVKATPHTAVVVTKDVGKTTVDAATGAIQGGHKKKDEGSAKTEHGE